MSTEIQKITPYELYKSIAELTMEKAEFFHPHLIAALNEFAIYDRKEIAHYLGQVAHESAGLTFLEEIWGPNKWQKLYSTKKDLGNWKEEPMKVAKELGIEVGRLYKGYGGIQRTGYNNIKRAADYFKVDFVRQPKLLATPEWCFRSDLLFWKDNEIGPLARAGNIVEVTRKINRKLLELDKRIEKTIKAMNALGVN